VSDDATRASLREAFLLLNRDFQQLSQRVTEWIADHEKRLTRGGERFARIDLQQQGNDAALAGLKADYSRAMASAEQALTRTQDLDRQVGASLRLANKVQQDLAALQQREAGDDQDLERRTRLLTWAIGAIGATVVALELVRYVRKR
jgi:predicted component of type VI protein secretion system